MKNITTTQNVTGHAKAMSEAQVDAEFARVAGALEACPRRTVTVPASKQPGEDVVELGFNGRMFLIRRGEEVCLPEPLIEILEHAGLL